MTERTPPKRPDLLDGFLILLLAFFCGFLVHRLTPITGWSIALGVITSAIVFCFWFMSRQPAATLLTTHLPVAAFLWLVAYGSVQLFNREPFKARVQTLTLIFLFEFFQLSKQTSDRKA